MEKIQNWKPFLILAFVGGVAATIVTLLNLWGLIVEAVAPKNAKFENQVLCSTPNSSCLIVNSQLNVLLEDNIGGTITADFQYEFMATGQYYTQCMDFAPSRQLQNLETGGYRSFVPLSSSDCKNGFFLEVPSAISVFTTMSWVTWRVKGDHTVQYLNHGGVPLYRLEPE